MTPEIIDRAEFDQRLEQSTARMRKQRLALEKRAAELEDIIRQYASVLERLEAESEQGVDSFLKQRDELRSILTELAARTSAVAESL